VEYVAISLATGQSYQSTYAVAALPAPAIHPQSGTMALPLPANGAYKLTVYTATGHTVWWNSVYLNVDNKGSPAKLIIGNSFTAYTSLITGNIANSYFENIQCSSSS
jgi:hypothetical protein